MNSDISTVEQQVLSWIGLTPLLFKVSALLALHVVFFELTFLTLCHFSSNPVLFSCPLSLLFVVLNVLSLAGLIVP